MSRRVRAAVLGYYGRWNLGDDLMARDVAAELRASGREVRLLSGDAYLGRVLSEADVTVAPRSLMGLLRALAWCDELVFAGGTIFHDSFTDAEFADYRRHLQLYAALFHLTRLAGKRVRLVGVGLGPLRREAARRPARSALGSADTLYVRDAASLAEAKALGAPAKLILGPDLSLMRAENLVTIGQTRPPEQRLGLSLLDMSPFLPDQDSHVFWDTICEAVGETLTARPDLHLTLFAFWTAPDRPNDSAIAERFKQALPETVRNRVWVCAYEGEPDRVVDAMADCQAIVATRFHAAVLAQALGRPYAVIPYNRKVSDFADACGLPKALRLPGDRPASVDEAREVLNALLDSKSAPPMDASMEAGKARQAVAQALETST